MAIMDEQLTTWLLFDHVERHFGDVEIVTQRQDGERHRYQYAEMATRTYSLMNALDTLGISEGGRFATLAWNSFEHLECYFGVPGTGRVLHTLNSRLSLDDLTFIINDAEDEAIIFAPDLLEVVTALAPHVPTVRHFIIMGDHLPTDTPINLLSYEELLAASSQRYPRKNFSEYTPAGLCYTSGTTGRPKGALYTHRSTYLHAQACASGAGMQIGPSDCVLPVVPMFHANAWGMVYAGISVGAKIVFGPPRFDPPSFLKLLREERVTVTGGVPTVWIALAEELAANPTPLPDLREIICGGSQPPVPLIKRYRDEFGLRIVQAWGMTETSPLASIARPKHHMRDLDPDTILTTVQSQGGTPLCGIAISLRDADGNEVPFDGSTMGNLYVRGAWVVDSYTKNRSSESFTADGWFQTGDVAIGNPAGYFTIVDRTKDLIKSGGEWISSVAMEGALMGIDGVVESAVIAVPDPKWQERPLPFLVLAPGATITLEMIHTHLLNAGFAKWQLPERFETIDSVPRTSVGKFDKKVLRQPYGT